MDREMNKEDCLVDMTDPGIVSPVYDFNADQLKAANIANGEQKPSGNRSFRLYNAWYLNII